MEFILFVFLYLTYKEKTKKQSNHSCCCQRSFHVGRRDDDERLLPCNDVGADTGRERRLLLFIVCKADEGRLG